MAAAVVHHYFWCCATIPRREMRRSSAEADDVVACYLYNWKNEGTGIVRVHAFLVGLRY